MPDDSVREVFHRTVRPIREVSWFILLIFLLQCLIWETALSESGVGKLRREYSSIWPIIQARIKTLAARLSINVQTLADVFLDLSHVQISLPSRSTIIPTTTHFYPRSWLDDQLPYAQLWLHLISTLTVLVYYAKDTWIDRGRHFLISGLFNSQAALAQNDYFMALRLKVHDAATTCDGVPCSLLRPAP